MKVTQKSVNDAFWKIHQAFLDLFLLLENEDEVMDDLSELSKAIHKAKKKIIGKD